MDQTLHDKIQVKLQAYLNRDPTEDEISNGQTDIHVMQWIAQDDAATQNDLIASVAQSAGIDVAVLKAQSLQVSSKSVVKLL
jgi:hypothetical protein